MRTWVGATGGGGHSFLSQYCRPPGQAKGASFLCPRMWNRTNSPNASFFYTFRRKFISRHIGITLWWSSASTRALSCVGLCLRKDRVGVWETWPQTGWQIGPTAAAKGKEATKQVPTKEQLSTSWWCIRRPNRVPAGRRILYPWVSREDPLIYLKCITNKNLLFSMGNTVQCYVAIWMGRELRGEWIHVYIYGWVPLLSTWNYHNIVNWLYSSKK